jgi:hypothetical protein
MTPEWQATQPARAILAGLDPSLWSFNRNHGIPFDYNAWEPRNEHHLPEAARRSAIGAYGRLEVIRARHLGITDAEYRACIDDEQRLELIARNAQAMTVSDAIGCEFDRRHTSIRSVAA